MKRFLISLIFIFLLVFAVPAAAQRELVVDVLQVQLWPEYDQPSMLVIYTLELSADQPLPADVTVRIPKRVGIPSAVAVLEDTTLVTRQYTRAVNEDWAEITLQADFPVIQVEYYDAALSQQDQPRTYEFSWLSDYEIKNLMVSVKQPVNSSGMNIQPSLGAGVAGSDGLLVYASSLGPLPAGQTFELSLSYNKSDATLSFQNNQQSVPGSQAQPTVSITDQLPPWAWGLIGLGVVVLVGGGVLFYRSNRSYEPSSSYRRKKQQSGASGRSRSRTGNKSNIFCHQCGTQAFAGDKFCRECGTKLRL